MIPRRKRSLFAKIILLCLTVYIFSRFRNTETPSKEEDSKIGESKDVNQAKINDNHKTKLKTTILS